MTEVTRGEHPHQAVVVLSFPDENAAEGCYRSEAYQALVPLRDQAMESVFVRYRSR